MAFTSTDLTDVESAIIDLATGNRAVMVTLEGFTPIRLTDNNKVVFRLIFYDRRLSDGKPLISRSLVQRQRLHSHIEIVRFGEPFQTFF